MVGEGREIALVPQHGWKGTVSTPSWFCLGEALSLFITGKHGAALSLNPSVTLSVPLAWFSGTLTDIRLQMAFKYF